MLLLCILQRRLSALQLICVWCCCWHLPSLHVHGQLGESDYDELQKRHSHAADPWALRMVHNLFWNASKHYMAVHLDSAVGARRLGLSVPKGFEQAQISFFYGMDAPNMRINFKTDPKSGAAFCEIGVIPDNVLDKLESFSDESAVPEHCWFDAEKLYEDEQRVEKRRQTAFCIPRGLEPFQWRIANGTFNPPSKEPRCLSDFYHEAEITYEYNLFRYCTKGYFFNGKDYTDPDRRRGRKDWMLFLAEGKVSCGISGNVESDRGLLTLGYMVQLLHLSNFERDRFIPGLEMCPEMNAVLASYKGGKDREGKFFFGAVVGAGKMEGDNFTWSYRPDEKINFWDEQTMQKEYAGMNLGKRACYLNYHKMLRRMQADDEKVDGRYNLFIGVSHYCTPRSMLETVIFDVSVGPKQVPDGVFEDTNMLIDLSAGRLVRSTGQVLCALGKPTTKESPCEEPQVRPVDDYLKKFGERCGQPRYTRQEWNPTKVFVGQREMVDVRYFNSPAFLAYPSNCEAGTRCFPIAPMTGDKCYANPDVVCSLISFPMWLPTCYGLEQKPICLYSSEKTNEIGITCGPCLCRKTNRRGPGAITSHPGECAFGDLECDDDKFCAYGKCRKWRMKEDGEPCKLHFECYPGFLCKNAKCQKIAKDEHVLYLDIDDY